MAITHEALLPKDKTNRAAWMLENKYGAVH